MTGWALLAYALILALPVAALLRRAAWTSRAPRLAMFTWFSLAASTVLALVSTGVLLFVPATGLHRGVADFALTCLNALEYHYGLIGGSLLGGLSVVLALGLPLLLAGCGLTEFLRVRRGRREHRRDLMVSARRDRATSALVVEHDTAAAYCLPGRGGVIVVTTGAMRAVDGPGLAAVLHHERAHLNGRHHLLTALANALHRPLCFLPLFAALPDEIARLVELRADDVAAARSGRRLLAASLLAFAESRLAGAGVTAGHAALAFAAPIPADGLRPRVPGFDRPGPVLAASASDTVDRMRRLVTAPVRLSRPGSLGIAASGTAAMVLPIAVTVVSLATVTYMACCS